MPVITIRAKLICVAVLNAVFISILGFFGLSKSSQMLKQMNMIGSIQLPAVRNMTLIDMSHDAVSSAVLGAVLAGNMADAEAAREAGNELADQKKNFQEYLSNLENLPLTQATKRDLEANRTLIGTYLNIAFEVLSQVEEGKLSEATKILPKFKEVFAQLEKSLDELARGVEADSKAEQKAGEDDLKAIKLATILAIAASGVLSFVVILNLLSCLKSSVQNVSSSTGSLTAFVQSLIDSSKTLADSVTRTASSLEETAAATERLSALMKSSANISDKAKKLSLLCRLR